MAGLKDGRRAGKGMEMQVYRGKSVLEGTAIGTIQQYQRNLRQVCRDKVQDPEAEIVKYRRARETALEQLTEIQQRAAKEVGGEAAAIFESHKMILEDGDYNKAVENAVRDGLMHAECAVAAAEETFCERFSAMEDDYMRARAADVQDVCGRLLGILQGAADNRPDVEEAVILVAEELTPSETILLDKSRVAAFVTRRGSLYSHTAILARDMGIPALVETQMPGLEEMDGKPGIVDGTAGLLYVEPEEKLQERFVIRQGEEKEQKGHLEKLKGKENVTQDGRRIQLYANAGRLADVEAALRNDAGGIGLFRSEFVYLDRENLPTEEEQFTVYRAAVETMGHRPTIIRTLDIGADKKCDYLKLEREDNPALGCRAIRLCLARPELFRTQLRALLRASAFGRLGILYPMITGVGEVRRVKSILQEVREELSTQGIRCGSPQQGIMIETPAAVMLSRELAEEVDFFSIGTNDLTQYTLAADRQHPGSGSVYDARHPAVLRMIRMTVENAHEAGIRVGICGELGADKEMTAEFLAMGVDELSVAPDCILPLRQVILETNVREYLRIGEKKARAGQ